MPNDNVVGTITIDSEENDDWMKSLPGYADEVGIHESLGKEVKPRKKKLRLRREGDDAKD